MHKAYLPTPSSQQIVDSRQYGNGGTLKITQTIQERHSLISAKSEERRPQIPFFTAINHGNRVGSTELLTTAYLLGSHAFMRHRLMLPMMKQICTLQESTEIECHSLLNSGPVQVRNFRTSPEYCKYCNLSQIDESGSRDSRH